GQDRSPRGRPLPWAQTKLGVERLVQGLHIKSLGHLRPPLTSPCPCQNTQGGFPSPMAMGPVRSAEGSTRPQACGHAGSKTGVSPAPVEARGATTHFRARRRSWHGGASASWPRRVPRTRSRYLRGTAGCTDSAKVVWSE